MLTLSDTKIAVEPLEEPDRIGSIILVDQAKSRSNQGIVKYIGPTVSSVQVGDHVLFGGYAGHVIHLEGEGKLIILAEEFIQAIIHDDILDVPGLYFKSKDGSYFPATLEGSITLIKEAHQESDLYKKQREYRIRRGVDPERETE